MKRLLICFLLGILLVTTISGFSFDNIKSFDKDIGTYGKITIDNAFGLGSKLAEYTLDYNTDQCLINCRAEGTTILYSEGILFSKLTFRNIKDNVINLDSNKIYIEVEEEYIDYIPQYENIYGKTLLNGTKEIIGSKQIADKEEAKTRIVWKLYNGEILSIGTYKWKIEGKKKINEDVDWVGTALGIDLTNWAWWSTDWENRKQINITGDIAEVLANFTVLVNITHDSDMQTDFDDIRFVNGACTGTQTDELYYEEDRILDSNSGLFWIKIPSLALGTNQVCMYYANSGVASTSDTINTWDGNYVGIWHMNEGTGTTTLDSMQFGNGTFVDVPTWNTTGAIGNALSFDGTNDAVSLSSSIADLGGSPMTIEAWINPNEENGARGIFVTAQNNGYYFAIVDAKLKFGKETVDSVTATDNVVNGSWLYGSIDYPATTAGFYQDKGGDSGNMQSYSTSFLVDPGFQIGSWNAANYFSGSIDEVRVSNVSRSSGWRNRTVDNTDFSLVVFGAEVIGDQVNATQSYPVNGVEFVSTTLDVSCNFSASVNENITAVKVLVYDGSNNLDYTNTESGLSSKSYNKTWTTTPLDIGLYNWSCFVQGEADTDYSGNRTAERVSFINLVQSYSNSTTEGNTETFQINFTAKAGTQISSGTLVYNNTRYLGSHTNTAGDNYTIKRTIDIPNVDADINISFYWDMLLGDSSRKNSTTANQSVSNLSIDDCSSYSLLLLNYTLYDEGTQILIPDNNNITIEVSLDIYPLGSSTAIISYSSNYSTNNSKVCLEKELSYSSYLMDVITRYDGGADYISEFNHIQSFSLTNATMPQNVNLYDLLVTDSQEFLVTYKDENFIPTEDVLVDVTRKYVAEGVFKSVEVAKTDSDGQTLIHLALGDVIYTLTFKRDGAILATLEDFVARCENSATGDCKINVNAFGSSADVTDFTQRGGISYTENFDEATRTITVNFNAITGTKTVSLNATKYDRFGNQTVCSDSLTSSSGTLTCIIPSSFGNLTTISKVYSDGELISTSSYSIQQNPSDMYGGTSIYFLALIVVVTMSMMFISDVRGVLLGGFLGLILCSSLVIVNGGNLFTAGTAITWALLAVWIIFWKINKNAETL